MALTRSLLRELPAKRMRVAAAISLFYYLNFYRRPGHVPTSRKWHWSTDTESLIALLTIAITAVALLFSKVKFSQITFYTNQYSLTHPGSQVVSRNLCE